ncbi:MAG: hypothetical protein IPK67_13365 [Planctomycetes bacterium]|nr:hypothetical protein [Planctomycetota bacterium]
MRSFSRSSAASRFPGKELLFVTCSSKGGVTQGCRWAPSVAPREEAISRITAAESAEVATGCVTT